MGFQLRSGNNPQFKNMGSSMPMGGHMPRSMGNSAPVENNMYSHDNDSAFKGKWWKKVKSKVKGAVKKIFGGKKKSSAATPNWADIHKKIQEAAKKAREEKKRRNLVSAMTDTQGGSNALDALRQANPWLPEQG